MPSPKPKSGFTAVPSFTIDEDDENPPPTSSFSISSPTSPTPTLSNFYATQPFPSLTLWFFLFLAGLFLGLTIGLTLNLTPLPSIPQPSNEPIYLNSEAGLTFLEMGSNLPNLLQTIYHTPVQINQANCGIATSASILNTVLYSLTAASPTNISPPISKTYKPYEYYTQINVRNTSCVSTIMNSIEFDGVETPPYGMTLNQVKELLECHVPELNVEVLNTDLGLEEFRDKLSDCFKHDNCHVAVNFLRSAFGQPGGGHWSPLVNTGNGVYALIDVAKYKEPYLYYLSGEAVYEAVDNLDDCGVWNWPEGQKLLTEEERRGHNTVEVMEKLGCREEKRGVVLIYEE